MSDINLAKLIAEGKSVEEIKAMVQAEYEAMKPATPTREDIASRVAAGTETTADVIVLMIDRLKALIPVIEDEVVPYDAIEVMADEIDKQVVALGTIYVTLKEMGLSDEQIMASMLPNATKSTPSATPTTTEIDAFLKQFKKGL